MKKLISRVCCLCCVVFVLAACLPLSAFAVDPVSAGVIANAFAQAIAAYGASNGVAMTFDVANTDGIGETVHELWKDFREGTQDADDYATLAAALFPDLYYKASSVVAGAADVYTVGYNISSTYAEEFDNFFDWLLSGPAEMVKVDNSYYQFASSQIGPSASSLTVVSFNTSGFSDMPFPYSDDARNTLYHAFDLNWAYAFVRSKSLNYSCYAFGVPSLSYVYFVSPIQAYSDVGVGYFRISNDAYGGGASFNTDAYDSTTGLYYGYISDVVNYYIPTYASFRDGLDALSEYLGNPSATNNSVGVKAATNTGVAQFPDTSDPNYEAVGKQIPSTVPWDNSAYGDGTGTLTDAQSGAIAAGADSVIARDGVLDLAGTDEATDEPGVDDPPSTDPDDYAVPGLAEIFPFCIPFDIYNFLSALSAQPVAPHFTATLDFPEAVGGTQTIDIDFDSPTWNQLAQLLRLLELLAFIIGLALLTRSMFIRG